MTVGYFHSGGTIPDGKLWEDTEREVGESSLIEDSSKSDVESSAVKYLDASEENEGNDKNGTSKELKEEEKSDSTHIN